MQFISGTSTQGNVLFASSVVFNLVRHARPRRLGLDDDRPPADGDRDAREQRPGEGRPARPEPGEQLHRGGHDRLQPARHVRLLDETACAVRAPGRRARRRSRSPATAAAREAATVVRPHGDPRHGPAERRLHLRPPDGQLRRRPDEPALVTIPILNDGQNVGPVDRTVVLNISQPTAGVIGPVSTATLTIVNRQPSTSLGPVVTGISFGGASAITSMTVSFSKTLDPATASNPANYTILPARTASPCRIRSVTFDPTTKPPSRSSRPGRWPRAPSTGSRSTALPGWRDRHGPSHNPDRRATTPTARPVGNYEATFARSSRLSYVDSHGGLVSPCSQTGGGLMGASSAPPTATARSCASSGARPFRSVSSPRLRPRRHRLDQPTGDRRPRQLRPDQEHR